jgi:hypothetical protein
MAETPYIGFSNDTLRQQRQMRIGENVKCPHCLEFHEVRGGVVKGRESDLLMFYSCGKNTYLCGLDGKSIMGTTSDVSGSM